MSERLIFNLLKDPEFPKLKVGRRLLFEKEQGYRVFGEEVRELIRKCLRFPFVLQFITFTVLRISFIVQ